MCPMDACHALLWMPRFASPHEPGAAAPAAPSRSGWAVPRRYSTPLWRARSGATAAGRQPWRAAAAPAASAAACRPPEPALRHRAASACWPRSPGRLARATDKAGKARGGAGSMRVRSVQGWAARGEGQGGSGAWGDGEEPHAPLSAPLPCEASNHSDPLHNESCNATHHASMWHTPGTAGAPSLV